MASTGISSGTAQEQVRAQTTSATTGPMGETTSTGMSAKELGIETIPNEAPGVHLSEQQKIIVGSVLDLFKGLPTLQKLSLWTDDATFADPITDSMGRKKYSAQWYGLKAAFSNIDQLSQMVTSDKNPISIDLKSKYKLAGLGMEKTIESKVMIWTEPEGGPNSDRLKITKVEDRWNGEIPEGPFSKVRSGDVLELVNPFWWLAFYQDLSFWVLMQVWESRAWEAFRNLNAVVVPAFVSVPKNEEDEAKRLAKEQEKK